MARDANPRTIAAVSFPARMDVSSLLVIPFGCRLHFWCCLPFWMLFAGPIAPHGRPNAEIVTPPRSGGHWALGLRSPRPADEKKLRGGYGYSPVTPFALVVGAADRIRTGDVQLGKLPLGVAEICRHILSRHLASALSVPSIVVARLLPRFWQN